MVDAKNPFALSHTMIVGEGKEQHNTLSVQWKRNGARWEMEVWIHRDKEAWGWPIQQRDAMELAEWLRPALEAAWKKEEKEK